MIYFTNVSWLSRVSVLKRVLELRAKMKRFTEDDRMNLAFLVNIAQQVNTLNLKLQVPGQLITAVYESVKA